MATIGYARVSTDGQTLDQQIETLKRSGAQKVFSEKQSGAKTDRKELAKALAHLLPGDVLLITRLDRLARSTRDLLNLLHQISQKGAAFKSLADPWCDTTTPHGELMVTILAGLATFERHLIKSRTDEGRKRARANGTKFGRKFKLSYHQQQEVLARLAAGETQAALGKSYRCDATTIGRIARRQEEQEGVIYQLPKAVQRGFAKAGLR